MDCMSFKFPDGTKQRLQSLALERESLTGTIIRALDALESIQVTTGIDSNQSIPFTTGIADLERKLAGAIQRIEELERRLAPANATQHYSDDICLMTFEMKKGGASNSEIAAAVSEKTGRSVPTSFTNNLCKLVKRGKSVAGAKSETFADKLKVMAFEMRQGGASNSEIFNAIQTAYGYEKVPHTLLNKIDLWVNEGRQLKDTGIMPHMNEPDIMMMINKGYTPDVLRTLATSVGWSKPRHVIENEVLNALAIKELPKDFDFDFNELVRCGDALNRQRSSLNSLS